MDHEKLKFCIMWLAIRDNENSQIIIYKKKR